MRRARRRRFLRRYGFGQARHYVLWQDRAYDSKAILGVAQRYATGTAARSWEFGGGKQGAALVLRELGLEVIPDHGEEDLPAAPPGRDAWQEASELGMEAARSAWAGAARELLLEVAGSLPRARDLPGAGRPGAAPDRHPDQPARPLLGRRHARAGRPGLRRPRRAAVVGAVRQGGRQRGAGYVKAVVAVRGELEGDPDDHAAAERLACYRAFGADSRRAVAARVGAEGRGPPRT